MERAHYAHLLETMKFALTLLLSIPAFAQLSATLNLTIYDSSGIAIPGARITVGYSVSPISAGFISDQNGRATVHLASGSYRITVESASAVPLVQIVNVNGGQILELSLRLAETPVPDPPLRPADQALRQAELEPGQAGGFIEGAPPYGVRALSS